MSAGLLPTHPQLPPKLLRDSAQGPSAAKGRFMVRSKSQAMRRKGGAWSPLREITVITALSCHHSAPSIILLQTITPASQVRSLTSRSPRVRSCHFLSLTLGVMARGRVPEDTEAQGEPPPGRKPGFQPGSWGPEVHISRTRLCHLGELRGHEEEIS